MNLNLLRSSPSSLYKSRSRIEFSAPVRFLPPSSSNQWRSCRISCQKMSCKSPAPPVLQTVTVTISYPELIDKNADLSMKIEEGFGPNGLGILTIADVPGFSLLRQNLLRLSPRLASLPEEVKKELEDPNSRYNFGWSHGKEKLESGKPDMLKGSFYANPILDIPTTEAPLIQRYPSYCGPNIWPKHALPELEVAFKALGKLILDVGSMVAYHCDQYVSRLMKIKEDEGLEKILLRSRCHKGRLLYYFPAEKSNCSRDGDSMSSWCGWHTDHGSLTGLTCGMFMRDAVEIPCPDSAAGLYIKTRTDQIVKVHILVLKFTVILGFTGSSIISMMTDIHNCLLQNMKLCITHITDSGTAVLPFTHHMSMFVIYHTFEWGSIDSAKINEILVLGFVFLGQVGGCMMESLSESFQ